MCNQNFCFYNQNHEMEFFPLSKDVLCECAVILFRSVGIFVAFLGSLS